MKNIVIFLALTSLCSFKAFADDEIDYFDLAVEAYSSELLESAGDLCSECGVKSDTAWWCSREMTPYRVRSCCYANRTRKCYWDGK